MKHPVCIVLFLIITLCQIRTFSQNWTYYDSLRSVYQWQHQHDSALIYGKEALKAVENAHGKDTLYADMLLRLFNVCYNSGDFRAALDFLEREKEIRQRIQGVLHIDYGTCLNNIALALTELGEYRKALPLFNEALEITVQTVGKEHPHYGVRLNNVASLHKKMGQYEKALHLFIEAMESTATALGEDHPSYGIRLNNLANLYADMAQYDNALTLYLEALANAENAFGKNHLQYSIRLNNLAILYRKMGQKEKALSLMLEALEITKKVAGVVHPNYITILNNLAAQYRIMKDYDTSLRLYKEAHDRTREVTGVNHPSYGTSLNNLAALYRLIGAYDKALPLMFEALENTEQALGKDHYYYGVRLSNLAALYKDMGMYSEALPVALAALDNAESTFGKDHPYYGSFLNILAGLYCQIGQCKDALPLYRDALQITYSSLRRAFSFISEREKEQFVNSLSDKLNTYSSFFMDYALQDPIVAGDAYDVELATKGMILQSGIQMKLAILNSGDDKALRTYEEWVAVRAELSRQYTVPLAERRTDIDDLEEEAEKLEGNLSRLSGSFQQSMQLGHVNWRDIQNSLSDNEVAVEFSSFRYMRKPDSKSGVLYTALVLRPADNHPTLVYLCDQEQLDSLLSNPLMDEFSLVNTLYMGIGYGLGMSDLYPEFGEHLRKLVWQPLEELIPEGSTVYFTPTGSFYQINLAALPYKEGKRLLDAYDFRQLSTTAMLLNKTDEQQDITGRAALFGGVNYNLSKSDRLLILRNSGSESRFISHQFPVYIDRGDISWPYLPGTREEVLNIARIFEKRNIETSIYTGNNALEENFKNLSGTNSPDILHIATHGFYFPAPAGAESQYDEAASGLSLFQLSLNPLNRSGLLFAGANHAWSAETINTGEDDGILTAYEVTCVTLTNTKLVVLSACETGLGDIRGSEGVFGLQRAFKAAGAKYILMSLWKVPDYETSLFMQHFYTNFFEYNDIFDAFNNTRKYMKELYPDEPYKWAAFVLAE